MYMLPTLLPVLVTDAGLMVVVIYSTGINMLSEAGTTLVTHPMTCQMMEQPS